VHVSKTATVPYEDIDQEYWDRMTTRDLLESAIENMQSLVLNGDPRRARFVEQQLTMCYRRLSLPEAPPAASQATIKRASFLG
jgi:hypothetical protein